MDFEAVFELLIKNFQKEKIDFAIIGGFAVYAAGYTRTTKDIDLLVPKEELAGVKKIMLSYGYDLIHESGEAANFRGRLGKLGQVDFLLAHRKYAKKMLERAQYKDILQGRFKVKIITPEDLIGLKVQSSSNDPERYHQDVADIEFIMRANSGSLDINLIREYFGLFDRQDELRKLLEKIKNA